MEIFKKYDNCIFCGSKNLKIEKKQYYPNNFYLDAIKSDLNISKKKFKKMKVFRCLNCSILQNNPWFTDNISRRIYSNIYGQHNRSWSNVIDFFRKQKLPNHGKLFDLIFKQIKIKKYAEFNSPFMGLFLNIFSHENKKNVKFLKKLFHLTITYLSLRQVAGKSKQIQKKSMNKANKTLMVLNKLKPKNKLKTNIKKYLFVDNSSLCWGQNDNYKSVNSKSLATEIFNLEIFDIKKKNKNLKLDMFSIFHTLDHTFEPKYILDYGLKNSKYVLVYCHVNEHLEKQHLFSITNNFLKYLKKKNIYLINLTDKIDKKFKSPELYFICSKSRKYIDNLRAKL